MMTEEEKRAKQLERYQELLESGAISQETYDRAVNKMQERTDMKDLGGQEVKSIASREIRFNASIPGAKRFTDELKAPTKETAKNTESIAKSAEETRDLIKERFGFDVVEIL
jgi:multidrug resistance efflux pump